MSNKIRWTAKITLGFRRGYYWNTTVHEITPQPHVAANRTIRHVHSEAKRLGYTKRHGRVIRTELILTTQD